MRRLSAILLILCWLGAFLGTHLPSPPELIHVSDKTMHSTGYLVLALVLGLFVAVRKNFGFGRLAAMLGVLAVYAAFDEITQLLVPNRSADFHDWLADVLGSFIGLVLVGCVWWLWPHRVDRDVADG